MKALSLLGFAQASGNLVSGYNSCLGALQRKQVKLVILAEDASPATKETFEKAARGVSVIFLGTKEQLGKAVGKPARAVLCVKDAGLAQAIIKAVNTSKMEAGGNHVRPEQIADQVRGDG